MKNIQILSAEDCPLTKVVLKQKMDKKGWELIETADGVEAIEKYNECNPDLILLDINMPRRDGVEVMEIIRLTNSQTPILFYSTLAKVEEIKAIIAKYKNNYVSNINHGIEGVIDDIEKLLADSSSMEDAYSKREKEQEKRRAESLKTIYKILRYAMIAMMVLSVVISTFLLLSCDSKEKKGSSLPVFSKENAVDTVRMSSLIKDWHYLALETKQECLMGRVGKISADDSLLFIEAGKSMGRKSILVFNREGKFIREIGCEGRAKNEYIYIECWAVDKWNKEVLICDSFKRKLMRYAYDGSFLGDIPFNDNLLDVEDMCVVSKAHLAFRRDIPTDNMEDVMDEYKEQVKSELDKVFKSQSRFLVTDRELNLVSRLSDRGIISEDMSHYVTSSIFVNKTIYARDPILNDTLYSWKNNQFTPEYLVYIDDSKASDIDIDSEGIVALNEKHSKEYKMFKLEQMVNNRYFFTEGNSGKYFIDLKKKSIHNLKLEKLENLSSPNSFYGLFTDENYLIASKDATAILELKELQKESNIEVSSKEQELYDSIEEDSNPVIFFYELKD